MKRQFALLFGLTFLVSGMATIAEEAAVGAETAETEIVEKAAVEDAEWIAPFEDGEWLNIPEWNAELYLPVGWQLFEVTETGFVVTDSEATSLINVTMEEFMTEETSEEAETTETGTEVAEEIGDAENSEENETILPSALESFLMEQGQEYELTIVGEREMAVMHGEVSMTVRFLLSDLLVTMEFVPADESGIADIALPIAETFHVNEITETEEIPAEILEEAAEE